jgi:thiol-disulfide isomerase/thioredoxin
MKRIAGSLLMLGLVAMFALNTIWIARNRKQLGGTRAGQLAPALRLKMLDGEFPDLRGKIVFLSFWATWCGPCVHELPDVQRLYEQYKDKVTFVAINVDNGEDVAPLVRAFKNRLGLGMPVALDDGSASRDYRVDTIPRTVIIDREGRIAKSFDGARSYDDMKEALDSLL